MMEAEYKIRRDILLSKLHDNSLGILFSGEYKTRSNDTEYPFRQNSNFYYLSGFTEDNSCLVFLKKKKKTEVILFVEKKDKTKELWSGKRLGKKEAKKRFLVDKVYEYHELEEKLKSYMIMKQHLYYDFNLVASKVDKIKKYAKGINSIFNLNYHVEKMRLIKSPSEINLIKRALNVTKEAHHKAMKVANSLQYEYELQSEIEYIFKKRGAYSDAYTSIIACGNSANTLHYIRNDKKLKSGKLILIDAGCEFKYYASDITRTIPVSGKFSEAQKELYEMVLKVELKIIEMIRPNIKRTSLQKKSEELLCKGMIKLGILKGNYKKLLKKQAHKKYYPHGIGHWMGLDVHDECPYKDKNGEEILLQAGMIMTIEPGIYIDENDKKVPKKYRGIGIRIEDDILITKDGYENLSQGIAKSVKEIEKISL